MFQRQGLKLVRSSINGINFLLKDSLGGGGMASMSIDPQGKSYAQQLLDYEIPVDDKLFLV